MVLMSMWRAWRAWGWQNRGPRRLRSVQEAMPLPAAERLCDELPEPPEAPWGCGWFDSSLDLREGLAVIEHEGVEIGLAVALLFDATARPRARLQASRPAR